MKKNQLAISCSVLSFLLVSAPSVSQDYGGSIALTTQQSDNATKAPTDEISERQDRVTLSLFGEHENTYLTASANYAASEYRYDKDSQENRSLIEGESFLQLGKSHQIADLMLVHSRRGVLNQPDAVDLLDNTDERQIISVIPTVRAKISPVDTLMLRGNYSEADYRYNDLRNSTSEALSLIWTHQFSVVDAVEFSAQQARVEFEANPANDYDYQTFLAGYSATLRQIEYRISAGYNRIEREDGDGFSGPTIELNALYDSGAHNINLYGSRRLTDSSMGSGNRIDFDSGFSPDNMGRDVTTSEIDQIERSVLELRWGMPMLCDSCDIYASVSGRQDDYFNLDEDNTEFGLGLGGSYRLSAASTISLRVQRSEQRFGSAVARDDFTTDLIRLEYMRNLFRDVRARFFVEQKNRKSDSELTDYDEALGGVSLTYSF